MNPIAVRLRTNIRALDHVFSRAYNSKNTRLRQIMLSAIVVRLHDQWNIRCRQIVLTSFGKSEGKMLDILQSKWSTRRKMDRGWEPDWHIPDNTIRAASLLNVKDYGRIKNALGAVTSIDDVRWTRNAIVHSVPTAFTQYRKMALIKYHVNGALPHDLPTMLNPTTSNSIYEDWCAELLAALEVAM